MGQRGPVRNPNSRRGQAEIRKRQRLTVTDGVRPEAKPAGIDSPSDLPTCDKCLPRRVQEIYQNLVIDLASAKVPIKQIDANAITMAARALATVETWEAIEFDGNQPIEARTSAARLKATAGKDLIQWLQLICATPGARARIGVKGEDKKVGPLAKLLAMKQGRRD